MTRPYDNVCHRLRQVTGAEGHNGSWRCPAHDDSTPSLSVSQSTDGTVLLHCHAGCDTADILSALELAPKDLFARDNNRGNGERRIVATYDYTDERGELIYQVVRFSPKGFAQRRPDGSGGWVWKLGKTRRVLFQLPQVLEAIATQKIVYVCEGEKDALAATKASPDGDVGTTCPQGAGKWRDSYTQTLADAGVLVVADNDSQGIRHATEVAAALEGVAAYVAAVRPPEGHKDLSDMLAAGLSLADLEYLTDNERSQAPTKPPRGKPSTPQPSDDDVDTFDDIPDEAGSQLLDDLRDWLTDHVAYQSAHHAPTVALWCVHTHAIDRAASTPRIAFESPEPESGKTRNLELMECVCHRGRLVLEPSSASIYRWVAALRPTILLDEADAIFGSKASKDHEDLRAIVNAGHRPGATVPRVETPSMKVVEFSCYSPVALAGIGGNLPDTIRSRSIRIPMRRRAPDETVRPFLEPITRPEGEALRRRLAAWTSRHRDDIRLLPELPQGVEDRQADQWMPLVAIADAAGGHWPETARAACTAIVTEARGNAEDQSIGIRLLADVRDAFDDAAAMFTTDLLAKLHKMDEAPWADFYGKPIDARWLARKLKPYGATPGTVRIGDATAKGYHAQDLHQAWKRYLSPLDPDRHTRHKGNAPGSTVTDVTGVTDTPQVTGTRIDLEEPF